MTATAQSAHASVLWTADAEHAVNMEWANEAAQEPSRVQRITSPVAQGNYAYSLELRPGDNPGGYGERDELGMGNPTAPGFPLFYEGDERWIAFQVYLPNDYPINFQGWNVILQLKQLGALGTPALCMGVEKGKFTLRNSGTNHADSGEMPVKWSAPATADRWVKFVLHVKFSVYDSVGFAELYGDLNGSGTTLLMPQTYMHTMKEDGGLPVPGQARIGQYRDSEIYGGVSHIYFDGFTIATDRASAEGNAFSPAGVLAPASVVSGGGQAGNAEPGAPSTGTGIPVQTPTPPAQGRRAANSHRARISGREAHGKRAHRASHHRRRRRSRASRANGHGDSRASR